MKYPHIADSFTLQLKNRFNGLRQDKTENSPDNTYNNFVFSYEIAAKESEQSNLGKRGGYQEKNEKKTLQNGRNEKLRTNCNQH